MNYINLTSYTVTLHHEAIGFKALSRGTVESEIVEGLMEQYGEDREGLWDALGVFFGQSCWAYVMAHLVPEGHREQFRSEEDGVYYGNIRVPEAFFRYSLTPARGARALRFLRRLESNPFPDNRKRAFDFLASSNLPLAEDGSLLAYKSVRMDFYDAYSRSMRYYPGDVPSLRASEVDTNTHELCSAGLHFCSFGYLRHSFFASGSSNVVLVKVAPEDIASIPIPEDELAIDSYRNSKGRAFRLTSICKLKLLDHDDFLALNRRLDCAVDSELEAVIREYTDFTIPPVEAIGSEPLETEITPSEINAEVLDAGVPLIVCCVKAGEDIYDAWLQRKEETVRRVARALAVDPLEITASESFITPEAPYARGIRFYLESTRDGYHLGFLEAPAHRLYQALQASGGAS